MSGVRPKVIHGKGSWQFAVFDPDHPEVAIDYVTNRGDGPTSLWLELGGQHNNKPIGRLCDLPGIDGVLHVHVMGASWSDLDAVGELHQLKSLNIGFRRSSFDFANVPNIEAVTGVWSPYWSNLQAARHIRRFAVSAFAGKANEFPNAALLSDVELIQPSFSSLDGVQECQSLAKLEVSYANKLQGIGALESLANSLTNLSLSKCKRIESYEALGQLRRLQSLRITSCAPMQSINFILGMPMLQLLATVETHILDNDLGAAVQHQGLLHFYGDNRRTYKPLLPAVQNVLTARRSDA